MPQETVHLARVRAWLACRRCRLLLLVHEFVLVKLVDVHPTEARGQRVPGHGGGSAPAQPAQLRARPQIHWARNRLGGGKRSPGTTSTSSARSRRRCPPTSAPYRNRKYQREEGRSLAGARLEAFCSPSGSFPDHLPPDSHLHWPSIFNATTALVLRLPSCTREAPDPGSGRRRHSPGLPGSSLPRLREHGTPRRRHPILPVECQAGFLEKKPSS